MMPLIKCPECGAGKKETCLTPKGTPAGYHASTKSHFHKARMDKARELEKHPVAVLGILGPEVFLSE